MLLREQAYGGFLQHSSSTRMARRSLAFHNREEIGPRLLARLSKVTELTPEDL
jgi:hypothetical protein